MKFREAMENKRFDLVVGFCFALKSRWDMTDEEIVVALEQPNRWEHEFYEWLCTEYGQNVFIPEM